jgi:hypothetical protein
VALLVDIPDSSLRQRATGELGESGLSTAPFSGAAADAGVVVVDGVARAAGVAESHKSLKVLALVDAGDLKAMPKGIAGFAIKPWAEGELALRATALLRDFETPEQVQVRLLATAVHAASDVVEITDPHARLQYVNPA